MILLLICTCTYIKAIVPSLLDKRMGKVGYVCLMSFRDIYVRIVFLILIKINCSVFRVHSGSVLGSAKGKVLTWRLVVSVWPSLSYFGHKNETL